MSQFPAALNPKEEDVMKMLASEVHIGTRNLQPEMGRYVWKRNNSGVHLINLQKTWEKLVLAARIIVTIENPQDICVISGKEHGQRSVLKFAKYTGAQAIAGRWTPGTLTNQIQDKFIEPRLLIVTDPRIDHQPIKEASYVNIPTIAFCNTDSPLNYVDVAIPCNNKGKQAIGVMWWMLAREVMYLRNTPGLVRGQPWDVMVDLFLYREPEDVAKEEAAQEEVRPEFAAAPGAPGEHWDGATGEWAGAGATGGEWTGAVPTDGSAQTWDASVVSGSNWDASTEQH